MIHNLRELESLDSFLLIILCLFQASAYTFFLYIYKYTYTVYNIGGIQYTGIHCIFQEHFSIRIRIRIFYWPSGQIFLGGSGGTTDRGVRGDGSPWCLPQGFFFPLKLFSNQIFLFLPSKIYPYYISYYYLHVTTILNKFIHKSLI